MAKTWEEMTPAEKHADLCDKWLNPPGTKFDSPAAEKAYKGRVQRFLDALNMKKPDRVPVFPMFGLFAAYYSGMTPYDMMYDYDKLMTAFVKYIVDMQPDAQSGVMIAPPGRVHEILDYKLYHWPGHGVPKEASYQAREGEYMKANEYDDLTMDPTNYFLTTWLPRVMGSLGGLKTLSAFTNMTEMYGGFTAASLVPFGTPPVQSALKALMDAGNETLKWISTAGAYAGKMVAMGYPAFFGGGSKAPFDTIGDTLRGTKGMILDMYRQPAKMQRALEQFVPIMVKMGASSARMNGCPVVFMPLHKGADGFMNDAQFKKFYWPTLKAVFEGLIAEGCIPFPWAEGGFDSRLDVIKDSPEGVFWGFDKVDMVRVKKLLGKRLPIGGNMPISTLSVGTQDEIKAAVKKLMNECAAGGGYIMMTGATIEDIPGANVKTFIDASKEYGVYK
ncbi:MAG: uroporphyrinogen decarboxylase family protein [Dehalococcoidales bacterium]|jgi:uroporphyrinogen-III decarboxylase